MVVTTISKENNIPDASNRHKLYKIQLYQVHFIVGGNEINKLKWL